MILIPVIDANDSQIEVVLDGDTYFLRMSWNSEGEFWVMSLEDYRNNLVLGGVLVVPDVPLLQLFRHLSLPRGQLWCVLLDDMRGTLRRTDFADGSAELVYVAEGEDATV
jgi:hypothetical protein